MFNFLNYPSFSDGILEIRLSQVLEADEEKQYVPSYIYYMYEPRNPVVAGYIDLRIGDNESLFYGGHIGYRVNEPFRGHGYAGRACRLIVPLALAHGMESLRITCSPDNLASKRTIEKLGAEFLGLVKVPPYNEMYQRGEVEKCIFLWHIKDLISDKRV
ncbi:MAG: GNAT family N-acetyltransferase [Symbiobacteriaceae bacterium]|nr:GNAT family N-acetyltransferase [Symbiobacteriaceae bacterium]